VKPQQHCTLVSYVALLGSQWSRCWSSHSGRNDLICCSCTQQRVCSMPCLRLQEQRVKSSVSLSSTSVLTVIDSHYANFPGTSASYLDLSGSVKMPGKGAGGPSASILSRRAWTVSSSSRSLWCSIASAISCVSELISNLRGAAQAPTISMATKNTATLNLFISPVTCKDQTYSGWRARITRT